MNYPGAGFESRKICLTQHLSIGLIGLSFLDGQIAQSVEQRIENPRVDSSILSLAIVTKFWGNHESHAT